MTKNVIEMTKAIPIQSSKREKKDSLSNDNPTNCNIISVKASQIAISINRMN